MEGSSFIQSFPAGSSLTEPLIKASRSGSSNTILNFTYILLYTICILLILIPVSYYLYAATTQKQNDCSGFDIMYNEKNPYIRSITDSSYNESLCSYYIKAAYNCCCPGNYKNDFVDLCALNGILKQGVRWLDIEVFSINNKPVIAASTTDNYYEKETYNSIPFQEFLKTINDNAFTDFSPNRMDPVFIHIRFKSNNIKMYDALTEIIKTSVESRVLGLAYNYNYKVVGIPGNPDFVWHNNLGSVPLNQLMNKIIFVVSNKNNFFKNTTFYEYVNLCSDAPYCNLLTQEQVQYNSDPEDLKNYNKQNMTFEIPNDGYNPQTPFSFAGRTVGIQCIGMRYNPSYSDMLDENERFFDLDGHAFVLKPEDLRYIPNTQEGYPELEPSASLKPRNLTLPLGINAEI